MKQLTKGTLLGGILLVAGTTLGAGMLAFPTITAFGGFIPSALLFLVIWAAMLASSFCFLDVHLWLKRESNMISMAEKTLGTWGKLLAWLFYLLLLYSLASAYIAGCTSFFSEVVQTVTGSATSSGTVPLVLALAFGGLIYLGTRGVDLFNRLLMIGLVTAYFLLVFLIPSQVDAERLSHVDWPAAILSIPIVITAFGYHIVIPTLSSYMHRDRKMLTKAIFIGSVIPILIYLLWQILVLGAVPLQGLTLAYKKGEAATLPLSEVLHSPLVGIAAKLFAFFAIVTSFIGVTMSLADFLTDGLKIKRTRLGRVLAIFLTFCPPLFFVYTFEKSFYIALQYAGAFVAILLVFLPAAMAWKLEKYHTFGRRLQLLLLCIMALGVVVLDILQETGTLSSLISRY